MSGSISGGDQFKQKGVEILADFFTKNYKRPAGNVIQVILLLMGDVLACAQIENTAGQSRGAIVQCLQ